MRKILAHVAARIVPATVHIEFLVGLVHRHALVPVHDRRLVGTVIVEVVEHRTECQLCKGIVFHLEFAGSRRLSVFGYLQRIGAGRDTLIEIRHIELAIVRPVVRIRPFRKRSCLDGVPARHQLELGTIKLGVALDDDADGHARIVTDLVVVEIRSERRSGNRHG